MMRSVNGKSLFGLHFNRVDARGAIARFYRTFYRLPKVRQEKLLAHSTEKREKESKKRPRNVILLETLKCSTLLKCTKYVTKSRERPEKKLFDIERIHVHSKHKSEMCHSATQLTHLLSTC